jgi:RNA polymerase sigma factor (sigma-70 family)
MSPTHRSFQKPSREVLSDEEIINDYLAGARGAFNLVTDWIRAVVHRRASTDGISGEDIIADARVKVFLNLKSGSFKFDAPLKSYVQAIAQYTIADTFRDRERARKYTARLYYESPQHFDPTDEIIHEDQLQYLLRVMNTLGDECRQIWEMVFREGLTYKDIAARMNMTEGAARVKAFRCKEDAIGLLKKFR